MPTMGSEVAMVAGVTAEPVVGLGQLQCLSLWSVPPLLPL